MTVKIKKPILITGISISFLLWFWQIFQTSIAKIDNFSFWVLIIIGVGFFFGKPNKNSEEIKPKIYQPITKIQLEKTFLQCENSLNQLIEETGDEQDLLLELEGLKSGISRLNLQVAIAGRNKSGKSSLKKVLECQNFDLKITFIEGENLLNNIKETAKILELNKIYGQSDLLLFVINGDLTASELQFIQEFNRYNQRLLLIFNQKDLYLPEEQIIIFKQIKERVKSIINSEDILAIATNPQEIKVKKYQDNGTIKEWLEKPSPELNELLNRLPIIINKERESLVLTTVYRQVIVLQDNIKTRLNNFRKKQALPIIEKYQWIAATTAFANPVSSLDLLATAAINTQLLIDLSEIYQQKLSLNKAKTSSITIAKSMVQLGIVEFSTQTLGSMLKTNALTYVAGGIVQGVSAAYLTRIAGLSLIEYLEIEKNDNKDSFNIDQLKEKIKAIFKENQRDIFLQNFVKTAVNKLSINNS